MPFRMHELRELIRLIDESRIDEFQMEKDGAKLVIKKGAKEQPAAVTLPSAPEKVESAPKPAVSEPAPAPSTQRREKGSSGSPSPLTGWDPTSPAKRRPPIWN